MRTSENQVGLVAKQIPSGEASETANKTMSEKEAAVEFHL